MSKPHLLLLLLSVLLLLGVARTRGWDIYFVLVALYIVLECLEVVGFPKKIIWCCL